MDALFKLSQQIKGTIHRCYKWMRHTHFSRTQSKVPYRYLKYKPPNQVDREAEPPKKRQLRKTSFHTTVVSYLLSVMGVGTWQTTDPTLTVSSCITGRVFSMAAAQYPVDGQLNSKIFRRIFFQACGSGPAFNMRIRIRIHEGKILK